jgi:divalent metal cation (Fe/Co/Zn/Cd) transporter
MEYIASSLVALLVVMLGVELGKASVKKILSPELVAFNLTALIILVVSILAKLWLYRFNRPSVDASTRA